MRKSILTMLAFLFLVGNSFADTIIVNDVQIVPGDQAEVTVRLQTTSSTQYAGWQMDISLPDGITAVTSDQGLQGQLGDCYDETFSLYAKHQSNGTDRWVAYSSSAHAINSGGDILFTFPITATETLTAGTTLTATVKNIIFTNPQGTENIRMGDVTFNITVGEKPQPWVFDLQAAIDSIAASANPGTASNPVQIQIPNEYLITSPITVHDNVFVRLTGGTLKLSGTFATSNDYVFLIEGGIESKSTLYLKNVTVDANSRALHYSFFKIQGDLYVESGVTYKNINTQTGKDNGGFYLNEGTLYVQSGTVNVSGSPIRGGGYTYMSGGVLKGSTCVNMNGDWAQGIRMGSGPGVEISGGELVATNIAIIPLESTYSGSATISGGKVTAPSLMKEGQYCNLYITGGQINVTQLITLTGAASVSGTQVFVSGNVDLDIKMNIGIHAKSALTKPWVFDCSTTNFNTIKLNTGGYDLGTTGSFEEKTLVVGQDYELKKADFEKMTFTGVPDSLEIYYNEDDFTVSVRLKDLGIEVNEDNFPDGNFRSFILSQWYGKDGWLYQREIKGIMSMDVSNQSISDLTGIKYFTELKKLNVSDNQLVSLDLSSNAKLDTLNCDNNQLASLDLSANTALTNLRCAGNQLMCITLAEGCDPGTYYEGENIVVIGSGASHEQYLEKPVKMLASGKYGIKVPSDFDFARLSQFVVDGETYYRGGYSDFPITMNSDRYIVFPSADDPSRISYTYAFPSEPSYLYPYKDNRLVVYVNVTEITDKPVALLGDVNNDGVVSISDAVCIISWLQENTLPVFIEGAADYNKDGSITVSDAIAIIQALLNEEVSPVIPDIPDDDISHLYPTASAEGIDVELLNAPQYTAFTMDVTLPNDMSIEDITLDETRAPHHQLASKRLANGKYRVIAYSPTLEGFNGNDGTLLTIKTNGKSTGKVNIENIHFVDMNAQEHALHNANGNVTGINQAEAGMDVYTDGKTIVVDADQDAQLKVYTATGLLYKTLNVKAGHNRFGDNATGIYIVNGKKINIR